MWGMIYSRLRQLYAMNRVRIERKSITFRALTSSTYLWIGVHSYRLHRATKIKCMKLRNSGKVELYITVLEFNHLKLQYFSMDYEGLKKAFMAPLLLLEVFPWQSTIYSKWHSILVKLKKQKQSHRKIYCNSSIKIHSHNSRSQT